MTDDEVDRLDDAEVYAQHADRLVALATTLAGPSVAENVVSAAMVRVLSSSAWPEVADRGAYLTRAVVNEVRSSYRSALRREARARLPLRQRACIVLTYWSDAGATSSRVGSRAPEPGRASAVGAEAG